MECSRFSITTTCWRYSLCCAISRWSSKVEVRTLKYDKDTRSASKDLQTVQTTVTVNYHAEYEKVNYLYKEIGLDYENRVIGPAVEETVKQVTANYNAEELITKRPLVKGDIENAIRDRLNQFYVDT